MRQTEGLCRVVLISVRYNILYLHPFETVTYCNLYSLPMVSEKPRNSRPVAFMNLQAVLRSLSRWV